METVLKTLQVIAAALVIVGSIAAGVIFIGSTSKQDAKDVSTDIQSDMKDNFNAMMETMVEIKTDLKSTRDTVRVIEVRQAIITEKLESQNKRIDKIEGEK